MKSCRKKETEKSIFLKIETTMNIENELFLHTIQIFKHVKLKMYTLM